VCGELERKNMILKVILLTFFLFPMMINYMVNGIFSIFVDKGLSFCILV
jgi:hypothetical protein